MKINEKDIDKIINKVVSDNKVINQTVESLNDYGFDFKELNIEKDFTFKDENIDLEIDINYLNPHFLSSIYKKNNIDEIEFSYNDFNIEIDEITSEELTVSSKSKLQKIQEYNEEIKDLLSSNDEDENINIDLSKDEDEINDEIIENRNQLKSIKTEIETTINAQLQELKSDTLKLVEQIKEKVEEYIELNQGNQGFKGFIKNFKDNSVKNKVISIYMDNVELKEYDLKEEIVREHKKIEKQNELIKAVSDKFSKVNIFQYPMLLLELRTLKKRAKIIKEEVKFNKSMLKDKISILKNKRPQIKEELIYLINEKFDDIALEKYLQDEENIKVTRYELYQETMIDYSRIAKKFNF